MKMYEVLWHVINDKNAPHIKEFQTKCQAINYYNKHKDDLEKYARSVTKRNHNREIVETYITWGNYKIDFLKEPFFTCCIKAIRYVESFIIPIFKSIYFQYCRGYTRNGWCGITRASKRGFDFVIAINEWLLDKKEIIEVIIHELLHTIPETDGIFKHGKTFRKYMAMINEKAIYNITISKNLKMKRGMIKQEKIVETHICEFCGEKFYFTEKQLFKLNYLQWMCSRCQKAILTSKTKELLKKEKIIYEIYKTSKEKIDQIINLLNKYFDSTLFINGLERTIVGYAFRNKKIREYFKIKILSGYFDDKTNVFLFDMLTLFSYTNQYLVVSDYMKRKFYI